jgi:hypothetical protein
MTTIMTTAITIATISPASAAIGAPGQPPGAMSPADRAVKRPTE